jgi:hypothetical protein
MYEPDQQAPRQPAPGPASAWSQRVLFDCCLTLIVLGALTVLIGLVQLSLGLLLLGVLLAGSGIEGIAWEMAHRGPRRSSSRDG